MPKLKTHKATAKRFRRTKGGKGKLVRSRLGRGHFRRNKSKRAKRKISRLKVVDSKGLRNRVRNLMPNLGRLSTHKRKDSDAETK